MILVDAKDVAMSRPGKPLFSDLSVTVGSGDRLGVVGVNGTGKSTLLGVLAGTVTPESGTVRRGKEARVTFLDQAAPLPAGAVRDVVGADHHTAAILDRLDMTTMLDATTESLSGGEAKRVALARALVAVGRPSDATDHQLLILDEPTNHLDIEAIGWLEDWLSRFKGGLVLVTHDRHVLDRLSTRMLELEAGNAYVHDGGYASYLDAKAERRQRAETAEKVRRNLARAELAWLRRGAPARTSKPKAHVAAALDVVNGRPVEPERPDQLPLDVLTQAPRLGNTVLELHGVTDGYGDQGRDMLFRDLDLVLDRRERLGVVGPNGSGKSTLLDAIAGRRQPKEGHIVRGQTVRLAYYSQTGRDLPLDARVRELVAGPARQPDWSDAALLERFWFSTDTQWAPVRLLSGGERKRLQLVLALREGPNVLLLDEPTNDLDLDTLRSLEDLMETWSGALVVVSHDRAFLERTVDQVLVMDGHGQAARLPGGYAAYEVLLRDRAAARRPGRASSAGGAPQDQDSTRNGKRESVKGDSGRSTSAGRNASTLRHKLRQAQTRLSRLQTRHSELETELTDAAEDVDRLTAVGEDLAKAQSELAQAEEEWLELAEAAESIGLKV